VGVGLCADVGAVVARNGCNPGMPDAFAGTSTFFPAGKRYDCPDGISPILISPNADSIEVLLSALISTMIFEGAAEVGSM